MTVLLEFREKIKTIYSRNDVFILPVLKFLLAMVTLSVVNGEMGYMNKLDNMAIVLIIALLCSFLPVGAIVLFATGFSLLHMYALSLEVAAAGLAVYMVLYLLLLRFCPQDSLVLVFTVVLCMFDIPHVAPVVMGLVGTPVSAVSIACGIVIYYLLHSVTGNALTIGTMGDEEAIAKLRLIIDGVLQNKSMLIMIVAFSATVVVVYLIRRLAVDYAWTIAIAAGVLVDLMILLIGDLLYDTNIAVGAAILGALVAAIIAKIVEFFRFCVDYGRTEKVQFEDDEYYYYVKAVPKMMVAAPTKTVKKINTQRNSVRSSQTGRRPGNVPASRTAGNTGNMPASRTAGSQGERVQSSGEAARTVTTVRTGVSRNGMTASGQYGNGGRKDHLSGGRSMTISSNQMTEKETDEESIEFEEIF